MQLISSVGRGLLLTSLISMFGASAQTLDGDCRVAVAPETSAKGLMELPPEHPIAAWFDGRLKADNGDDLKLGGVLDMMIDCESQELTRDRELNAFEMELQDDVDAALRLEMDKSRPARSL